jgi:ABC-type sugar transport system substrate-binding protein
MCSTDTVNIGRINTANGLKYVGAGYNLTPDILKVIADGSVFMAVDPPAYLVGYLPIALAVEAIQTGQKVPHGFLPIEVNVVTEDNVATFQDLEDNPEKKAAYYDPKIPETLWPLIQPPENSAN